MVTAGGILTDRKGVNVPNAVLPVAAMTDKDRADLEFALTLGVDWIALSFVQRAEDVAEARKIVQGRLPCCRNSKPAAIDRLDEIITLSDAVMVARGDLGVELPARRCAGDPERQIIRQCREGQTRRRRHPDAGIDDQCASPDPGRSLRCGVPSMTVPTR